MIREAIIKVAEGRDLTAKEMEQAFSEIMNGTAEPVQISAFITALRMKGETVDEITAAAKVMRRFASTIDVRGGVDIDRDDINVEKETILDTCGTGGSGTNTFNISTTVAFVVAGCGVKVAKHGNRSASSQCGSADVLERLGVGLNLSPKRVAQCTRKIGIGFMFAPLFHSAMKYAVPVRKAIGIRTIFNILGPLANPANATCQVLGVYDKALTEVMAKVLGNLGTKRAFVVHGLDTLDEVSITGPTQVSELKNKLVRTYKVTPGKFGLKRAAIRSIKGGSAKKNAAIVSSVLKGAKGPCRDVVLLNAAYALVAAGRAKNVKAAIRFAQKSIDSGAAQKKLEQLKAFTAK
ncbi:MAG: anthranilate phosphoribosyltransferase [Candidatus Omnitrophica bacterium]|nr:anthranilate phosphoribosyltransferase [Candidatus Omnitrophota bacterium]